MPAELTDKMRKALSLIMIDGMSPQQAATIAGVQRQSIYKTKAYKKFRSEMKAAKCAAPAA